MNSKSNIPHVFSHKTQLILALIAMQFPVTGYCNSENGWFDNLFASKSKNIKEAAVKVAELHEDEDINIWGLDFSPDGKYLAATSPNTVSMSSNKVEVQIWDWQSGRIVRSLEKAGGNDGLTTEPIRYSPDGRLLVACHSLAQGDVVARIWNTETWAFVHDITDPVGGGQGCGAIGFTPDGKSLIRVTDRIVTNPGDNLFIYNTSTWQPVWGLRTVPFEPHSLAVSPDGKFVAVVGQLFDFSPTAPGLSIAEATKEMFKRKIQSQIAIVDIAQHTIVRTTPSPRHGQIAWSPDGAHITVAGAGEITVFDMQSGKQVADEPIKSGHISVRYTPDGKYLIEGVENGKETGLGIRIWDSKHRELLQDIPGNVRGIAVSRDGHYFAAGGYKKISVWRLK